MTQQIVNIAWVVGGREEAIWSLSMAKILEKNNFKVFFLTNTRSTYNAILRRTNSIYFINDLANKFPQNDKYIEAYSHLTPSLNAIRLSDLTLCNQPIKFAYNLLCKYAKAIDSFFIENKIESLILFPTAAAQGRIPYSIAKSKKIKTLIPFWGPVHNDTFVINDLSEEWLWSELNTENHPQFNNLNADDIIRKIEQRLRTAQQPCQKSIFKIARRYFAQKVLCTVHLIKNTFKYDFETEAIKVNASITKKEIVRFLNKPFFKYDSFDSSCNYVFFPFHCHYDSTLIAANPMFVDQIAIVKNIARALPPGVTLYIKEHPYDGGYLSLREIKELKAIGNIQILPPELRSIDIICNTKLTITVSSSAGWESMLFKKPVLVLGNSFYAFSDLVYKVNSIRELSDRIKEALKNGENVYNDNIESYRKDLNRIIQTSRHGNAQGYKPSFGWEYDINANAQAVASGIQSKLERMSQ